MKMAACAALFLAVFCIVGSLALLNIPTVFACTCVNPKPPSEAFNESDAVFAGRATNIEPDDGDMIASFVVERAWKGVQERSIIVKSSSGSASCGYDFEEGKEYLVYALFYNESLNTATCGRTQPLVDAYVDLAALGSGYIPSPGSSSTSDMATAGALALAAGACAAVVGVVAFMMVRQWRKK